MKKVVSLGIHIADMLGRPVTRIPDGQDIELIDEIRVTVAGTAAGTSVDLAKLGMQVYAMGAIGNDALGGFVIDTMGDYGIDVSGLVRTDAAQTSATLLPIRPNGDRPGLHVVGANGEYGLEQVVWKLIEEADHVHVGGTYLMPMMDGEPTARVLRHARDHGATTSLDLIVVERPDLLEVIRPALPELDYFMPGLDEARRISGLEDRQAVIDFFLERGVGTTVFKMGAEGSSIANKDGEALLPAFEVGVVDSTGCGDAYSAGFIAGLMHGWDHERCGLLGTAAASLVIGGLGSDAGIVDFGRTVEWMESAPRKAR